jgi:hypothetical protein
MGTLDDRRLEAELGGPNGGDVAARPRADDDDVERTVGQIASPTSETKNNRKTMASDSRIYILDLW